MKIPCILMSKRVCAIIVNLHIDVGGVKDKGLSKTDPTYNGK